jgi:hypothetical protein
MQVLSLENNSGGPQDGGGTQEVLRLCVILGTRKQQNERKPPEAAAEGMELWYRFCQGALADFARDEGALNDVGGEQAHLADALTRPHSGPSAQVCQERLPQTRVVNVDERRHVGHARGGRLTIRRVPIPRPAIPSRRRVAAIDVPGN